MTTTTCKARAYREIRSQHSRGSSSHKYGGPDTYVAVQIVPEGSTPLRYLQAKAAKKRGIEIKYFGEGYSDHRGSRSSLGKAIAAADEFVAAFNAGEDMSQWD